MYIYIYAKHIFNINSINIKYLRFKYKNSFTCPDRKSKPFNASQK